MRFSLLQSSTISIMTGHQLATSDSVSSVTTECELYSNLMDGEAASWLDTVGWEDRKKDDMESFRKPLSKYVILSPIAISSSLK